VVTSVSGQLMADFGKGLFTIDAPASQALIGSRMAAVERVSNLAVTFDNAYAAVIATSLDDRPLARSAQVLISAVGNAVNRGALLDASGGGWQARGAAPVMIEAVRGRVQLTGLTDDASSIVVYYLSQAGQRLGSVPIDAGPGSLAFELNPRYRSVHYEVVRESPEGDQ
jgi:hypothetical protein